MNKIKVAVLIVLGILFLTALLRKITPDSSEQVVGQKETVKAVSFDSPGMSLKLEDVSGEWIVNGKYKADQQYVADLIIKMRSLLISDEISGADYGKFGLSDDKKISVSVKTDSAEKKFYLGKSSSGKYYIMKKEKGGVCLAEGISANTLKLSEDAARDKTVISAERADISRISVTVRGKNYEFEPRQNNGKTEYTLISAGGPFAAQAIEQLMSDAEHFRADKFIENIPDGNPVCSLKVILKSGREMAVDIFDKTGDGFFPCRSTECAYGFSISAYRAGRYTGMRGGK